MSADSAARPAAEPLRVVFRRQVREQALEAAHAMVLDRGWDLVRVGQVAEAVGVSRPTLYKEFGDKAGLGEALVLRETERFLDGIAAELGARPMTPTGAVTAAVRYTLREAQVSPMLHAVLTSSRGGTDSLLPLLTTRSAPLLEAATHALVSWFDEHAPALDRAVVVEAVDALVRLTVSHLVLPAGDPEQTADRLARVALRHLGLPPA